MNKFKKALKTLYTGLRGFVGLILVGVVVFMVCVVCSPFYAVSRAITEYTGRSPYAYVEIVENDEDD